MRLNRFLFVWFVSFFLFFALPSFCLAQDIEPRRWSHLPMNVNFAGIGYAYTTADIFFDPVLEIEDAEMEMDTWAIKYLRTFAILQKSARIEFMQGYQEGKWDGLVSKVPTSITRRGLADSILRFAVNLYGAPPLKEKEFADYRAAADVETIVGTALVIQIPTGEYMEDKLINLGSNRFTFRPQLGMVHTRGKLSVEFTVAAWFYTDNNDFYYGNKLEQDPLYTLQSHCIYTFRPGFWASGSFGYAYGGESSVNGADKDDQKQTLGWGLSFGFPITRQIGAKLYYIGIQTQESTGQDSDSFAAAISYYW